MSYGDVITRVNENGETEVLEINNLETSAVLLARRFRVLSLQGQIAGWPVSLGNGVVIGRTDEHSPVRIMQDLLAMNRISDAPITLYIDSPGGDVDTGMALYDVIKYSRAPVTTIAVSVASMATLVAAAGHRRLTFPHSRLMLHLPSGGFSGDPKDAAIHAKELNRVHEMLVDCYLECGLTAGMKKKSPEQIKKRLLIDIDRDHWLTAQEAVRYGIGDGIAKMEDLFIG